METVATETSPLRRPLSHSKDLAKEEDNLKLQLETCERSLGHMLDDTVGNELYIGNVPHDCTELHLWELFSTYGKVVNVSIHQGRDKLVSNPTGAFFYRL